MTSPPANSRSRQRSPILPPAPALTNDPYYHRSHQRLFNDPAKTQGSGIDAGLSRTAPSASRPSTEPLN